MNRTQLPYIDALLSYDNIHIITLDIDNEINNYAMDTPLADWAKLNYMLNSSYITAHMNDYLRAVRL